MTLAVGGTLNISKQTLTHRVGGIIKKANTIEERRSKINRNSVFNCHLSPRWRQMAIENTVSIEF